MTTEVLCLRPASDFTRAGLQPPTRLTVAYRAPDDRDVAALMRNAGALIMPAVGPALDPALFAGSALRLVQVTGAGVDRLDAAALRHLGIPVANVPGGSNRAVAEYAVTSASVLLRGFAHADTEIKKGNYVPFRSRLIAENRAGLEGLMVGVIGLGVIGMAVAQTFHRMGCRICYHDQVPRPADAIAQMDAQALSLADLLQAADVVTLHVPLLPATRGLIGADELASMKPGAILIQGSRGGVVDEAALAAALTSGHLGGAAVDVYSTEPPDPSHPLLHLEDDAAHRVLLTPHIAGVTRQSLASLLCAAVENVERVLLRDEAPLNRVY